MNFENVPLPEGFGVQLDSSATEIDAGIWFGAGAVPSLLVLSLFLCLLQLPLIKVEVS